MTELEATLAAIDSWGADHVAASVVGPAGVMAMRGDPAHRFRWASVTKPITALTVLVGCERGLLDLDEPAGPPGATVRHLLAHASGLPFEGDTTLAPPATRRIYSNTGFDLLGSLVADAVRRRMPLGRAIVTSMEKRSAASLARSSPSTLVC